MLVLGWFTNFVVTLMVKWLSCLVYIMFFLFWINCGNGNNNSELRFSWKTSYIAFIQFCSTFGGWEEFGLDRGRTSVFTCTGRKHTPTGYRLFCHLSLTLRHGHEHDTNSFHSRSGNPFKKQLENNIVMLLLLCAWALLHSCFNSLRLFFYLRSVSVHVPSLFKPFRYCFEKVSVFFYV